MKKILSFLFVFLLISCSSEDNNLVNDKDIKNSKFENSENISDSNNNDFINNENLSIINRLTSDYHYQNENVSSKETFTGIVNEDYIKLYNNSIRYLINEGGLSNEDIMSMFTEEYDQRVIITAMAVSEYNKFYGDTYETASSGVGNCVLEAVGINALVNGAGKKIATKVLSRFIPYAGWGLAALDFVDCMDWI